MDVPSSSLGGGSEKNMKTPKHRIVLITGSRDFRNEGFVLLKMHSLQKEFGDGLLIVNGAAPAGVDGMVNNSCTTLGISHVKCPANWKKFRRSAGIIRNNFMLAFFKPELVLGISSYEENDIRFQEKSPGTYHCIQEARRRKIPTRFIGPENII